MLRPNKDCLLCSGSGTLPHFDGGTGWKRCDCMKEASMDIEFTRAYTVYASTGCSCCNRENHYRGPWRTREEAEAAAARYRQEKLLASQYAPQGRYNVEEHGAEILPDGRIILGGSRVLTGFVSADHPDDYIGESLY